MKFNQKKFVKRFITYNRNSDNSPENSTDEFNFFPAYGAPGEISIELPGNAKNAWGEPDGPNEEGRRSQIKKPHGQNKKSHGNGLECTGNEMWTFGDKHRCRNSEHPNADRGTLIEREKTFWKISRTSLPAALAEKNNRFTLNNPNMLWRSLEHIQQLYEDGYVHQVSEILNLQFENLSADEGSKPNGSATVRKARLSRWNFLRYDSNGQGKNDPDRRGDPKPQTPPIPPTKSKSYSRFFFVRKKTYSKSETDLNGETVSAFDDSSSCTEETCNCSCCSCDTCTNGSTATSHNSDSSKEKMAPNSEEDFQSKRAWGTEFVEKEPLRPPVYNPEDYATSLKKWGRKTNSGMQMPLYLSQSTGSIEKLSSELGLQSDRGGGQSSVSTKSSSSIKSGDDKHSKKERDFTLKMEKKDLKNKENLHRGMKNELNVDFRNPILALATQEGEMSLRQFSSVTELLGKLKVDLKLSFPSFVQEFVGDPVDGVTLLLELLRAVQLSQASQQQRRPPQIFRKALLDEHSCLVCLKHCLRCSDATRRLVSSSAGLFTLAVCIMSNVTQSRIIALELLTKACEIPCSGHKAVSEALSTLRLRFGEPVRFRFLVGMLNSAGTIDLLSTAMKFINVFVETAPSIQQKVYIQAELEQAGFDAKTLRKTLPCNSESVKAELNKWERSYLDVENLQSQVGEVSSLQEKIQLLEKRIEILQEEKGILQSLEQCLKERCSELEEEMSTKTNTTTKTPSTKQFHNYNFQQGKRNPEKGESTPAEDEGISSSEQELSQDEDYVKSGLSYGTGNEFGHPGSNSNESSRRNGNSVKDVKNSSNRMHDSSVSASCSAKNYKNIRGNKMKETNVDDGNEIIRPDGDANEEEETTIDEVIEELENIVNDAETEVYCKEEARKAREKAKLTGASRLDEKTRAFSLSPDKEACEETEIIPAVLHPQPPRKAKSLVHIYLPRRDFDSHDHGKNEFFDEDTDTESSDSLLTATREKKSMNNRSCHRSLDVTDSFGTFSSTNTRTLFIKQEDDYEESELNVKMGYEERNIDEEMKRKHLKANHFHPDKIRTENFSSPIFFKDNKFGGDVKKPVFQKDFIAERISVNMGEKPYGNVHEKTTSFQGIQSYEKGGKSAGDEPRKTEPRYPPAPVKRSQTFHISTSDVDVMHKRADIKPKPKMGVSGLDFQRNAEQKYKNDQSKYQSFEYKKNLERRPESNDRYSKRMSKDSQKIYINNEGRENPNNGSHLCRRGSFDGVFSAVNTVERVTRIDRSETSTSGNCSPESSERPCAKIRSKSLEKMDEGLDALVDIVIAPEETKKPKPKTESNVEQKNIGPRTRRSLAESSLFIPPRERITTAKVEESPVPPKPAQRTSLTRHNSSSTPLHLPKEIKLAPVQPNPRQIVYNFGMKSAKSEDSLFSASKRCPPDGSSNPTDYKGANSESQPLQEEHPPIYSTPVKSSKAFGEPNRASYYSGEYLDKPAVSPMPRNLQNVTSNQSKVKSSPVNGSSKPTAASKPNFLLGTYQSPSAKNIPKPSSSVMNSINNFNNTFLSKKSNGNNKMYPSDNVSNGVNHRKLNSGTTAVSDKLTDTPSGLY